MPKADQVMTKKMIDPQESRIPIWIVTSLHENSNFVLRAVCLDQARANEYRKGILTHYGVVNAWVYATEANHLYGEMYKLQ